MSSKLVTFRAELKSSIGDFLADAGMTCPLTEESLVVLVVALADHREEGKRLFPRVIVCDDKDAVLRNIQGESPITIGTGPRDPETALRALKKCAPLADQGWAIWIGRVDDGFEYGVFREPSNPTSIDLRRTMLDTNPDGGPAALLMAQFAPGKVELISAGRPGLRVHLTGERTDLVTEDAEALVVDWWSGDIEDPRQRESFMSFAATLLHDVLRKGHGSLVGVIASSESVEFAADAVTFETPIDLAALVIRHAEGQTSAALAELLDYSQLFTGMMASDGIVLLDTRGRLLAFNWFITTDVAQLSTQEQLGGARHRAYGALKAMVDRSELRGAFIRSADGGESAYGGRNHG